MEKSNGAMIKEKLGVDSQGNLVPTKTVVDFSDLKEIPVVNFYPRKSKIVLQPVPPKSVVLKSGIILPKNNTEMRCIVVKTRVESEYKRGMMVLFDLGSLPEIWEDGVYKGKSDPQIQFINGVPFLVEYEDMLIGYYENEEGTPLIIS